MLIVLKINVGDYLPDVREKAEKISRSLDWPVGFIFNGNWHLFIEPPKTRGKDLRRWGEIHP